jgi:hypothetical protein
MGARANRLRAWVRGAARFIAWGLLFSLVYGQSPLYTSNQNQYFLHAASQSGVGLLSEDWLANTADSVPVFTLLARLTYHHLNELFFYLYFALLCSVYLYSLTRLAFSRTSPDPTRRLLALTFLLTLNSALLRFALARGVGEGWAYLFDGGVAGQRLLGTVLQPSVFGVFLLLSITLFLDGRRVASALVLGVAATIHPTYLLTAGLLVPAYLWLIWRERRALRPVAAFGLLALLLVLPIALYVLATLGPTSGPIAAQAQEILVEERIPHHAVVAQWLDATTAVKLALLLGALVITRRSGLFPILLIPLVLGILLTGAQVATDNNALALLFPWRVSALLVPMATAVLVGWASGRLSRWAERFAGITRPLAILLIATLAIAGAARFVLDLRQMQADPAGPMIAYARENRAPGQLYLIPPDLQQFRLEAGIPAFVDLKSIPYLDAEVMEWFTRMRIEGWIYRDRPEEVDCTLFDRLRDEYRVTHVVLDRELFDLSCPALGPGIYADETYVVHEVIDP